MVFLLKYYVKKINKICGRSEAFELIIIIETEIYISGQVSFSEISFASHTYLLFFVLPANRSTNAFACLSLCFSFLGLISESSHFNSLHLQLWATKDLMLMKFWCHMLRKGEKRTLFLNDFVIWWHNYFVSLYLRFFLADHPVFTFYRVHLSPIIHVKLIVTKGACIINDAMLFQKMMK